LFYFFFVSFSQAAQTSMETKKTVDIEGTVVEAISDQPVRKALVIFRKGQEPGAGAYTI
jgi:hypothetical protein